MCVFVRVRGWKPNKKIKKQILTFFSGHRSERSKNKKKSLEKIQPYRFLLLLWLCCCDRPPPPTTSHHCFSLALAFLSFSHFQAFFEVGGRKPVFAFLPWMCFFFLFSHFTMFMYMIRLLYYTSLRFLLSLSFVCMCLRVFSVLFLHFSFPGAACVFVCMCVCVLMLHKSKRCFECVCVFVLFCLHVVTFQLIQLIKNNLNKNNKIKT